MTIYVAAVAACFFKASRWWNCATRAVRRNRTACAHVRAVTISRVVAITTVSELLKSSDLFQMGWTRTMITRLLSKPDKVEVVKKGSYRYDRYLYDPARVEVAMQLPEFAAAAKASQYRKAAPERRRNGFTRTYQGNWHLALPVVAEHLRQLNRFAKWRTCSESNKAEIYDLKNQFVRLLYESGLCSACWIHRMTLAEKRCRACYGEGDFCDRCDGTGVYQSEKVLRFYCFRFYIGVNHYTWHQPESLVNFAATVTDPPADWDGSIAREKPVSLPRAMLAEAKGLLRWVIETAAKSPAVEPLQHFSGEPITPVDAEQVGLFG